MILSEKEYRQYKAVNYSTLADFNIHPDTVSMIKKPTSFMEVGKIFEAYLERFISISSKNTFFDEKYCILSEEEINEFPEFAQAKEQSVPSDLVERLERGEPITSDLITLTKAGVWAKPQIRTNFYVDWMMKHPGKYPISPDTMAKIQKMTDNFLKLQVFDIPMKDILRSSQFQEPYIWKDDKGIEKKALYDFVCTFNLPELGGTAKVGFDIKTSCSEQQFKSMWYSKYWIQDRHYSEGIKHFNSGIGLDRMVYAVVTSTEPYTAFVAMQNDDMIQTRVWDYQTLVTNFKQWDESGRPYIGIKPIQFMK